MDLRLVDLPLGVSRAHVAVKSKNGLRGRTVGMRVVCSRNAGD
jgi:hypothetical protein